MESAPSRGVPLEPQRASIPLLARGFVALGYAVLALAHPSALHAIVGLFAAWALIDGLLVAIAAVAAAGRHTRWWPLLLQAVAGIAIGVQMVLRPPSSVLALLLVISLWGVVTGVLEIAAAMMLRRGTWLLGLSGVTSLVLGFALLLWPGARLHSIVALTVVCALISAGLQIALCLALRPRNRRVLTA
jgi:uncharacterized membrane protein HdeD (DUF308 family)